MNRQQAQDLIASILEIPHDGELQVTLNGVERLGTRFNDCAVSQNVLRQQATLTLGARLGQKKTSMTINALDAPDLIRQSVARVFETCRHMPDDEEVMPAPGQVLDSHEFAYSETAEAIEIETVGAWAAEACKAGAAAAIDLAGLLSVGKMFTAYGDSAGGFAHERHHRCDYHVTASGDHGSGWAEHQGVSIAAADVVTATERAIDKCARAQNPEVFEPRSTTVILEPQAVGDLMAMAFFYGFDQRARDEGRSAFSDNDRPLGRLSFYSDPADSAFPAVSFNGDGQPLAKSTWLDQGRLQQLTTSRYWASKQGIDVKPSPNNIILSGDGVPLEQLIAGTEDGILVTRFWYIRSTDAKTLGFTGMTRDGTYRIENGKLTHPVVDMRWNESVLRLLNNVAGSGAPVATGEFIAMAMPALRVEDFHFTSLSN
ncbi:MAG: metallopeptidase TldD-related protein [Gammaproteobacteria bacterium]|nr:metallopeptidase TldD-related protein [Gammaproteobacteria bacterium]MDH3449749.1 metallopeptidase TldD-related protein [Gammaproteobacteria bacterium]